MKFLWVILIMVSCLSADAQSKWKDQYYDSVHLKNFRSFLPFYDTIDIDNFDYRLAGAIVYYLTNEIRYQKKLSYLSYNKKLETAAFFHSLDMANHLYFDHVNRNDKKRRNPNDRALMAGVENPYIAENIVEGFILDYVPNKPAYLRGEGKFSYANDGPLIPILTYLKLGENLLRAWMNSPGHKDNILSENNLELGCGLALYFDKDFNAMPMVKATQVFQLYEKVKEGHMVDKLNPY